MNSARQIYRFLRRIAGHRLAHSCAASRFPPDFSPNDIEVIDTVHPFTMTSRERLFALMRGVEYIVHHQIGGDLVECGVWRGGSMMAAANTLLRLNCKS